MGRERDLERAQFLGGGGGNEGVSLGTSEGRHSLPVAPRFTPRFQTQHQLAAGGHCRTAFQMDPVPSDKLPPSPGRREKHCPGGPR